MNYTTLCTSLPSSCFSARSPSSLWSLRNICACILCFYWENDPSPDVLLCSQEWRKEILSDMSSWVRIVVQDFSLIEMHLASESVGKLECNMSLHINQRQKQKAIQLPYLRILQNSYSFVVLNLLLSCLFLLPWTAPAELNNKIESHSRCTRSLTHRFYGKSDWCHQYSRHKHIIGLQCQCTILYESSMRTIHARRSAGSNVQSIAAATW